MKTRPWVLRSVSSTDGEVSIRDTGVAVEVRCNVDGEMVLFHSFEELKDLIKRLEEMPIEQ
jgi:hypothetical protein